jgi:hypothetical protein
MSASSTDEPVFQETEFAGEISINGETAPITFGASAGSDCRLQIRADNIDGHTYFLAVRNQGRPGESHEEFTLTGTSLDGKTIYSAQIFVCGHGHDDDRRWIDLRSRACKITFPLERRVEKPVLRLWFRSFRSFSNPVIETSCGRLVVWGKASDVQPEDMSGCVTLEAPSGNPGDNWPEKADRFLRHMHRGLALAHGGRLQTPRLDYAAGLNLEITFFDGTGFTPEFPAQYHLNHGPFIQALVHRYETKGPLPDILWTALGWMQTDTSFNEMRFLSGMTALEAIIESQLPERRGTIIPQANFKPLRKKIEALIASDDTLSEDAREILMAKVSQLNTRVFTQKIHALFDHYAIPKRDFEGNVVLDLIKLRNEIVHRGFAPNSADLWPSIILVRELITRVLLNEIGFVGRYCCYIGGLNDRDFPGEL